MNREQLRALFRADADDLAQPYLFEDPDVNRWLDEAEEEAAVRADLLFEAADEDICNVDVTAGVNVYTVSPLLTRITYAEFTAEGETEPCALTLIDRVELTRIRPRWRTTEEAPRYLIVEPTNVQLGCLPIAAGTLRLEGYRLPLAPMASDGATPEIQAAHHRFLVLWALYRAYSVPDAETRDPGRAQAALDEFERRFGPRPDADMKQAGEAVPQFNKVHL